MACIDYVEGNHKPSLGYLAEKYSIDFVKIAKEAIETGWDTMRANKEASLAIAVSEQRLARVINVDNLVLNNAEKLAKAAFCEFDRLMQAIREMPLDIQPIPSNATPAEARRIRADNAKEITTRAMMISAITKPSMDLSESIRDLGLVTIPDSKRKNSKDDEQDAGTKSGAVQINQINVALSKAKEALADGQQDKPQVNVTNTSVSDGMKIKLKPIIDIQ